MKYRKVTSLVGGGGMGLSLRQAQRPKALTELVEGSREQSKKGMGMSLRQAQRPFPELVEGNFVTC